MALITHTCTYVLTLYQAKLQDASCFENSVDPICVVPIRQATQVHNKNSNIQERSINVIKVIFHTIRNCS